MVTRARKREPYAKLKKLVDPRVSKRKPTAKDIENSFVKAAALLKNSGEVARLQVQIIGLKATTSWCLTLVDKKCTVERKRVERPEIEIITTEEVYWELAKGAISPGEAFFAGKMEISGDSHLMSRIYKRLASRGRTDLCVTVKEVR